MHTKLDVNTSRLQELVWNIVKSGSSFENKSVSNLKGEDSGRSIESIGGKSEFWNPGVIYITKKKEKTPYSSSLSIQAPNAILEAYRFSKVI